MGMGNKTAFEILRKELGIMTTEEYSEKYKNHERYRRGDKVTANTMIGRFAIQKDLAEYYIIDQVIKPERTSYLIVNLIDPRNNKDVGLAWEYEIKPIK